MNLLSPEQLDGYRRRLSDAQIPLPQQSHYIRWLNLYRTQCSQDHVDPDSPAGIEAFIGRLRQRYSSAFLLNQARHAVELGGQLHHIPASASSPALLEKRERPVESEPVETQLARIASRVKQRRQQTIADLIADGQDLRRAKALCSHGQFASWLKQEFELSHVTANRLMQVADVFEAKILTVKNLSRKALYELAASGTPERIRQRALACLEAGESVSYEQIRAWKRTATRERPKPERSLTQAMEELDGQLARWTLRTRRQLEHYRIRLPDTDKRRLTALQERLRELDSLLTRLAG